MSDEGEGGFGGYDGGSDNSTTDSQVGNTESVSATEISDASTEENSSAEGLTELSTETSTVTELSVPTEKTELTGITEKGTEGTTDFFALLKAENAKTELSEVQAPKTDLTSLSKENGTNLETNVEKTADSHEIPAEVFETKPSTAYFYSGLGPDGDKIAADYARERGGTTLEMQLDNHNVPMRPWNESEQAKDDWRYSSRQMAIHASGDVHILAGDRMTADSVFATEEYPALLANEKVDRIISVDPKTGEETIVMDRHNPANNKSLNVYKTSEMTYVDPTSQKATTVTKEFVRFE